MRPLAVLGGLAILAATLIGWFVKSAPSTWPEQGSFEQQA